MHFGMTVDEAIDTADFLLSSPLMDEEYERRLPDLDGLI